MGTNAGVREGCAKSEARNNARVAPIYMVGAPSRRYPHHGLCTLKIGQGVIGKNLIFAMHRPSTIHLLGQSNIAKQHLQN